MTDRDHTLPPRYVQDSPAEPDDVATRLARIEQALIQVQRAVVRLQEQAVGS